MDIITVLKNELEPYGIKINCYFDRLHIYLDPYTTAKDLHHFKVITDFDAEHDAEKNKLVYLSLPHHPHLDRKFELFQPSVNDLNILANDDTVIKGDYAIQYLELALDFECKTTKHLTKLSKFFRKHVIFRCAGNNKYHFVEKKDNESSSRFSHASYYAPRSNKEVLVMYGRQKSKVTDGKSCLHLELRMSGLPTLRKHNIHTLSQLCAFDHHANWNQRLVLFMPNYTSLGQSTTLQSKLITRQAYITRGRSQWKQINCLQSFLSQNPHCASSFMPITTENRLHNELLKQLS